MIVFREILLSQDDAFCMSEGTPINYSKSIVTFCRRCRNYLELDVVTPEPYRLCIVQCHLSLDASIEESGDIGPYDHQVILISDLASGSSLAIHALSSWETNEELIDIEIRHELSEVTSRTVKEDLWALVTMDEFYRYPIDHDSLPALKLGHVVSRSRNDLEEVREHLHDLNLVGLGTCLSWASYTRSLAECLDLEQIAFQGYLATLKAIVDQEQAKARLALDGYSPPTIMIAPTNRLKERRGSSFMSWTYELDGPNASLTELSIRHQQSSTFTTKLWLDSPEDQSSEFTDD